MTDRIDIQIQRIRQHQKRKQKADDEAALRAIFKSEGVDFDDLTRQRRRSILTSIDPAAEAAMYDRWNRYKLASHRSTRALDTMFGEDPEAHAAAMQRARNVKDQPSRFISGLAHTIGEHGGARYGDEMTAAFMSALRTPMNPMSYSQNYRAALEESRAHQDAFKRDWPTWEMWASALAGVAGALPVSFAAIPRGVVRTHGMINQMTSPPFRQTYNMLYPMLTSQKYRTILPVAAGAGAVQGAGAARDAESVPGMALFHGLLGGGLAGGIPLAGRILQRPMEWFQTQSLANMIDRTFRPAAIRPLQETAKNQSAFNASPGETRVAEDTPEFFYAPHGREAPIPMPGPDTAGRAMVPYAHRDLPIELAEMKVHPIIADQGPFWQAQLTAAMERLPGMISAPAYGRIYQEGQMVTEKVRALLNRIMGHADEAARVRAGYYVPKGQLKDMYDEAYAHPLDFSTPEGRRLLDIVESNRPGAHAGVAGRMTRMKGDPEMEAIFGWQPGIAGTPGSPDIPGRPGRDPTPGIEPGRGAAQLAETNRAMGLTEDQQAKLISDAATREAARQRLGTRAPIDELTLTDYTAARAGAGFDPQHSFANKDEYVVMRMLGAGELEPLSSLGRASQQERTRQLKTNDPFNPFVIRHNVETYGPEKARQMMLERVREVEEIANNKPRPIDEIQTFEDYVARRLQDEQRDVNRVGNTSRGELGLEWAAMTGDLTHMPNWDAAKIAAQRRADWESHWEDYRAGMTMPHESLKGLGQFTRAGNLNRVMGPEFQRNPTKRKVLWAAIKNDPDLLPRGGRVWRDEHQLSEELRAGKDGHEALRAYIERIRHNSPEKASFLEDLITPKARPGAWKPDDTPPAADEFSSVKPEQGEAWGLYNALRAGEENVLERYLRGLEDQMQHTKAEYLRRFVQPRVDLPADEWQRARFPVGLADWMEKMARGRDPENPDIRTEDVVSDWMRWYFGKPGDAGEPAIPPQRGSPPIPGTPPTPLLEESPFNTEFFHVLQQSLDSAIQSHRRAIRRGEESKSIVGSNMTGALRLRTDISNNLKAINPAFARVQELAEPNYAANQAIELGAELVDGKLPLDMLQKELDRIPEAQRHFVAIGMNAQIQLMAARQREVLAPDSSQHGNLTTSFLNDAEGNRMFKELSMPQIRDTIRMLVRNPDAGEYLQESIRNLRAIYTRMLGTHPNVLNIAREIQDNPGMREMVRPGSALQDLLNMQAGSAMRRFTEAKPIRDEHARTYQRQAIVEALLERATPANLARVEALARSDFPELLAAINRTWLERILFSGQVGTVHQNVDDAYDNARRATKRLYNKAELEAMSAMDWMFR